MINIAELLRNAPKGIKLYSPLFGEVEYMQLGDDDKIWIKINNSEPFDKYGRYFGSRFMNAECLLFPSKDCRTWEGWKLPIKSKFKIGDWITDGTCKVKITDINNTYYLYSKNCILGEIESIDKKYHLWTIEDAINGDILSFDNETIVVFKDMYNATSFHSHCHLEDGIFDTSTDDMPDWWRADGFKPATKEQIMLLVVKMKEAGYQWDVDKKKLHKIQFHYDISNFQPFDKVLVRDDDNTKWRCNWFSHYDDDKEVYRFITTKCGYVQCIPFEKNEHLLGTINPCGEEYINW